jgi:uncharacterized protein (TIGR02391 family)
MSSPVQRFYISAKSKIGKDSDLPNFFVYFLTIELGNSTATVSEIRKCYEDCDLHPPSWLASHFSVGLRSKPRRFIKKDRGYRLEGKLREQISTLIGNSRPPSELLLDDDELAGIEYAGIAGASKDCEEAIVMLLQSGGHIVRARILTHDSEHCILLTDEIGDPIAIKSGFSSGYGGEGPRTFSYVLQLLSSHEVEIEEFEVDSSVIERIDSSALKMSDLKRLDKSRPIRPTRWHSYVSEDDVGRANNGTLWEEFPPVIPLAIIDSRVMDLALSFWKDPDDRLLKGYRRLEDLIRERTGVAEHGTKLLSQAFVGNKPKLSWNNIDDSEKIGRANLFTGAYMAYRNPRAHRELKTYQDAQLAECLLLNQLYRLEREAHLINLT